MELDFYKGICEDLLTENFLIIENFVDKEDFDEKSSYFGVFKMSGAVANIVMVVRSDNKEIDYKEIIKKRKKWIKTLPKQLRVNNLVFLKIIISENADEDMRNYINVDDYADDENIIDVKWLISCNERKLICGENQPSKILGIEGIIKNLLKIDITKKEYANNFGDTIEKVVEKKEKKYKSKHYILTMSIIIANIIIYILLNEYNLQNCVLYYPNVVENGEYYRLISAMFIHFSLEHLGSNMLSLYIFGSIIEKRMSKEFFAICYMLTGIAGGIAQMLYEKETCSGGASGAIFGIEGALLGFFLCKREKLEKMDLYNMIIFSIIGLSSGFMIENVGYMAHLSGFVTGLIISIIWLKIEEFRSKNE